MVYTEKTPVKDAMKNIGRLIPDNIYVEVLKSLPEETKYRDILALGRRNNEEEIINFFYNRSMVEETQRRQKPLERIEKMKEMANQPFSWKNIFSSISFSAIEEENAKKLAESKDWEKTVSAKKINKSVKSHLWISLGIGFILALILMPMMGMSRGFCTAIAVALGGTNSINYGAWWWKNRNKENTILTIVGVTIIFFSILSIATGSPSEALWGVFFLIVGIATYFALSNWLVKTELIILALTLVLTFIWEPSTLAAKVASCKELPPMGIIYNMIETALEAKVHLFLIFYLAIQCYVFKDHNESKHMTLA